MTASNKKQKKVQSTPKTQGRSGNQKHSYFFIWPYRHFCVLIAWLISEFPVNVSIIQIPCRSVELQKLHSPREYTD